MFLFIIYNVKSCKMNILSSIKYFSQIELCDTNHEKNQVMLLI